MQEFNIINLFFLFVDKIVILSNSNFFTTFVSAGAGAGFGAWAAQWIVENSAKKKRLLAEINGINASIGLAFDITNSFLVFKKQHISNLYLDHKKLKEDYLEFISRNENGTTFVLPFNFMTLNPLFTNKDKLSDQMFEKFSASTKLVLVLSALLRAIDSLDIAINLRNSLINKHASITPPMPPKDTAIIYFGLENIHGRTDTTYPDTVKAIYDGCDDCIFFSKYLIANLIVKGKKLADEYGENAPKINDPDFSFAFLNGLIPDEENYKEWLKMFG